MTKKQQQPQPPFEGRSLMIGDEGIAVGRLPDRKRVALYHLKGNVIEPLAYFSNEAKARIAVEWLLNIAQAVGATWNPNPEPRGSRCLAVATKPRTRE